MSEVWVRGFEQISALGIGAAALARSGSDPEAWARRCPFAPVAARAELAALLGGEDSAELRQMDPLARYAVACASLLLGRTPFGPQPPGNERAGVMLGSAFGCTGSNDAYLEQLIALGPRRTSPVVFRNTVSNAAAGHLAVAFRLLGSNSVLDGGMVSGAQALAYAFEEISRGRCDEVVAGAADWTSELVRRRFAMQGERRGRPLLPLMDGACLFRLGAGRGTGAPGWRLSGYGMGFLGDEDRPASLLRVMQRTMRRAGVESGSVDAFQLHADTSAFWVRSAPADSIEETAVAALEAAPPVPFVENSAVPAALALAATLDALSAGRPPSLFARRAPAPLAGQAPRRLLFASLGADGNAVMLLLDRAAPPGKDA